MDRFNPCPFVGMSMSDAARELQFETGSLEETDRLGAALAAELPVRCTLSLVGPLGAGKTHLVQSIAVALGIPRDAVTSPTFVLCQEYHGRRTIYHLDAYRLADTDDFLQLGVEDYFNADALTIVEWGNLVADALPCDHWRVTIEVMGVTQRRFRIARVDGDGGPWLARIATRWADARSE